MKKYRHLNVKPKKIDFADSISQSVVPGLVVLASPVNLIKNANLWASPSPAESESLEM